MAKVYAQSAPVVLEQTSASLAANSTLSGSIPSVGYSKIVGMGISSGSSVAGSAFQVFQSLDGTNWDYESACALSTCTVAVYSGDIYGRFVKVVHNSDPTESTDEMRTLWVLRPI